MPLQPGSRIGPYEVTAPIGAGGAESAAHENGSIHRDRKPAQFWAFGVATIPG